MAQITITIDTSGRERARGAQWALTKRNEQRANQTPPLDPFTMEEFLVDTIFRLADGWADQQLKEETVETLKDLFLKASPSRRAEIIALINSPE
jgi:hypothetical protein